MGKSEVERNIFKWLFSKIIKNSSKHTGSSWAVAELSIYRCSFKKEKEEKLQDSNPVLCKQAKLAQQKASENHFDAVRIG